MLITFCHFSSALHFAAKGGNLEVTKHLIEDEKCFMDAVNKKGRQV